MAVDQRLQSFAVNIIRHAEYDADVPSEYRSKAGMRTSSKDCTEEMYRLVLCRLKLFRVKLMELEEDLEFFKSNDDDFIHYMRENMSKYFAYPHMNIFDKIFMSCAVVATMSRLLYLYDMSRKSAANCWVKYFEAELMEEFYALKDCWKAMHYYVRTSYTCLIKTFDKLCKSTEPFETDIAFAEYARQEYLETHKYSGIIETYKQRINRPLGSFCCSECLPLFDALYLLTFGEKLVSDFQLVEGYMQIFIRKALNNDSDSASILFHKRIFKNDNFENSEEEHGGYVCMFCGIKKEKSIAYLKSIVSRTIVGEAGNAETILDRNDERRALALFLKLGQETARS